MLFSLGFNRSLRLGLNAYTFSLVFLDVKGVIRSVCITYACAYFAACNVCTKHEQTETSLLYFVPDTHYKSVDPRSGGPTLKSATTTPTLVLLPDSILRTMLRMTFMQPTVNNRAKAGGSTAGKKAVRGTRSRMDTCLRPTAHYC